MTLSAADKLKESAHDIAKDVSLLKGFPSLHADMAYPSKREKFLITKEEIYKQLQQGNEDFFQTLATKMRENEAEFTSQNLFDALLPAIRSYLDSICRDAGRIGAVAELLNEKLLANT